MLGLILTIAAIALVIFLMNKKVPTLLVFLLMGFALALGITIFTKTSVASATTGNLFLDVFESFKETFASSFASTGMAMIPIYAYSVYMNKINASQALGTIISKPIEKSKNPYFIGVLIAIVVCGIMRVAIVSAFAIMALFLSTLYPALTRAGLSRQSAISAIFIGTCFDWGPADFVIAQMSSGIEGFSIADYFVSASLRVVPFVLLIVALTSGFIMQFVDKKSGYVFGSHRPEESAEAGLSAVPKLYAILPLLPLILILVFSPLFGLGISLSVMGAVTISFLIVLAVEIIRTKKLLVNLSNGMSWFSGMGEAMTGVFTLVAAAQFFAKMLGMLNGFSFLIDTAMSVGMSGYLLLIVFGILMFAMCLMTGGGGVVGITLAPQLAAISSSLGISLYSAFLPMQLANGCRAMNLGTSPHMQYVSKTADCSFADILKRCAMPCVIMYASSFVLALIIL